MAPPKRPLTPGKQELEFLADNGVITSQQHATILAQLPDNGSAAPAHSPVDAAATAATNAAARGMKNMLLNSANGNGSGGGGTDEKKGLLSQFTPPPPAYGGSPGMPPPPPLAHAVALYAYAPTDAGDLELRPNDGVAVLEYTNAEWWKGRNERSGTEGIFPRSYVRVEDRAPPPMQQQSNYGNVPMDVSQGGQQESKGNGMGKKIGGKLGNAALFGAGGELVLVGREVLTLNSDYWQQGRRGYFLIEGLLVRLAASYWSLAGFIGRHFACCSLLGILSISLLVTSSCRRLPTSCFCAFKGEILHLRCNRGQISKPISFYFSIRSF